MRVKFLLQCDALYCVVMRNNMSGEGERAYPVILCLWATQFLKNNRSGDWSLATLRPIYLHLKLGPLFQRRARTHRQ